MKRSIHQVTCVRSILAIIEPPAIEALVRRHGKRGLDRLGYVVDILTLLTAGADDF